MLTALQPASASARRELGSKTRTAKEKRPLRDGSQGRKIEYTPPLKSRKFCSLGSRGKLDKHCRRGAELFKYRGYEGFGGRRKRPMTVGILQATISSPNWRHSAPAAEPPQHFKIFCCEQGFGLLSEQPERRYTLHRSGQRIGCIRVLTSSANHLRCLSISSDHTRL